MSQRSESRNECSGCGATAPPVRTAGTLAGHGWRIIPGAGGPKQPATLVWLCPECATRDTGSAPLSNRRKKD